jgi:hypothetical protein
MLSFVASISPLNVPEGTAKASITPDKGEGFQARMPGDLGETVN